MLESLISHSPRKLLPLLALLGITTTLQAQLLPQPQAGLPPEAFTIGLDQPAPVSPLVTTGKLSNGMRYFIRKNAEPKNRAELRLVVDAGSVLEDDKQLGLAHLLEHMAFNGSEHFRKQEIISYMQSIGMKFGADLNASTSFDETTYMLQVPTDNAGYLDTAFQIIDDWASGLSLDDNEIKLERGVVIEEWRLGRGAQGRVRDKQLPVILKDSRYAQRLPIGTLENLQSFDPASLKSFYKDWYRPELMAVVAVGDFDPAAIEALIHKHLDTIPASKNPKARTRYDVPAQTGTQFVITPDPEVPVTQVTVYHKLPAVYDWTIGGSRHRMVEGLFNAMLGTRFQEIARQANPPFLGASSGEAGLVRSTTAHALAAAVPEAGINRGLETLLVETERAARFGFSAPELERQKTALLRNIDLQYTNRDSRPSASHAAEMIRAFLTGESIPGAEFETALYKRFVPGITLEEINQYGKDWLSTSNTAIAVTAPAKPGLVPPTEADLVAVIASAAKADLKPIEQTTTDEPLLSAVPKGSKVTGTKSLDGGLTEWTLANGIKVIIKPTDFKKDEILFSGFSPGGTSLVSDADYIPASMASAVIASGGLGNFNTTALQRKLAGKVANVSPYIGDYDQGLRGGGSPADLETLFQLIYLRMTNPRADTTYFDNFKTQTKAVLQNRDANPRTEFEDTFTRFMFQNHPRRQPTTVATIDQADLAKSLAFYQQRLGDASGFTFIFVGSLDPKVLQPLVETYIGGLPTSGRKENWKDVGIRNPAGVLEQTVRHGIEAQSSTRVAYNGPFDIKNPNARTLLNATTEILQTRLRNVMREQLSGTYSVQVSRQTGWQPVPSYTTMINFSSDPVRAEELTTALFTEIEKLQKDGPTDMEVADERQTLLRSYETGLKENNSWMSVLNFSYASGINPGAGDFLQFPKSVEAVTPAAVRDAMRQYFNKDNHIKVTLLPEKMPEKPAPVAEPKK